MENNNTAFKSRISTFLTSNKGNLVKWYFVTKIVLAYCEKKIVPVIEKNFEAEGQEFAMATKFSEKFAINMLKKRGLTHLDATPIFKKIVQILMRQPVLKGQTKPK